MKKNNLDIKLESIGGMGANLIGKILGETAAMKLGWNASNFSSYGSEKTGSPVTAFIRFRANHDTIIENTPIAHPDILGIFHHSLLQNKSALAGLTSQSSLVVNSPFAASEIRSKLNINCCNIYALDCQNIILNASDKNTPFRINMLMLGGVLRAMDDNNFKDAVLDFVSEMFRDKNPAATESNLLAIRSGYENTSFSEGNPSEYKILSDPSRYISDFGYANTTKGGILPSLGNTKENNLSLSRSGFYPEYIPEKCIHCGLCDTTCPDMVFTFREGEYQNRRTMMNQGPNHQYCKGCLRCVEICPTQALVSKKEIITNTFSTHGADPIITSEGFLSENVTEGALNE